MHRRYFSIKQVKVAKQPSRSNVLAVFSAKNTHHLCENITDRCYNTKKYEYNI